MLPGPGPVYTAYDSLNIEIGAPFKKLSYSKVRASFTHLGRVFLHVTCTSITSLCNLY